MLTNLASANAGWAKEHGEPVLEAKAKQAGSMALVEVKDLL